MSCKETLCWTCERAAGGKGCPWAAHADPVDGWDATPTHIASNGYAADSYHVMSCPLYQIDRRLIGKTCQMCRCNRTCKSKGHGVCSNFFDSLKVEGLLANKKAGDRH